MEKQGIKHLSIQRLSLKQTNLVKREFEFRTGKQRNVKGLAAVLS